jgi:hypothetical protein
MNAKVRLTLIAVVCLVGIGGAAAGTYDWYYKRYLWPADIQDHLFGDRLVDASTLLKCEGSAAWGQGMFRWTYRIDISDGRLRKLCGSQPLGTCRFVKVRHLKSGVDLDATYVGGVLTLEEWWK